MFDCSIREKNEKTGKNSHSWTKRKKNFMPVWTNYTLCLGCPRAEWRSRLYSSYSTFSAWASRDFKLLVTFFNSSSRSPDLLSNTRKRKGKKRKRSNLRRRTAEEINPWHWYSSGSQTEWYDHCCGCRASARAACITFGKNMQLN